MCRPQGEYDTADFTQPKHEPISYLYLSLARAQERDILASLRSLRGDRKADLACEINNPAALKSNELVATTQQNKIWFNRISHECAEQGDE
jgi:hypothetical protein